jgi:hypothetical protein
MPLRVTRVLIDTGIYPSPAADADVGEKLIAVGEVINFMWEIRSVGVLLTLIGCALLGWTVALGNRAVVTRHRTAGPPPCGHTHRRAEEVTSGEARTRVG